jgi:hypothetical protein
MELHQLGLDGVVTTLHATPPPTRVDAFRNMLAILHNLDAVDLRFLTAAQRASFLRDPIATTLRLDDAGLDALYALVQERQPVRYRT